jgi:hypothetical protein
MSDGLLNNPAHRTPIFHIDDSTGRAVVRGERHIRMYQELLPYDTPDPASRGKLSIEVACQLAGSAVGLGRVCVVKTNVYAHFYPPK